MAGKRIDELQFGCMVAAVGAEEIERLLEKYSCEFKSRTEYLRSLVAERNADELAREIHALKGVSSNFGFSAVAYLLDKARSADALLRLDVPELEAVVDGCVRDARDLLCSFS